MPLLILLPALRRLPQGHLASWPTSLLAASIQKESHKPYSALHAPQCICFEASLTLRGSAEPSASFAVRTRHVLQYCPHSTCAIGKAETEKGSKSKTWKRSEYNGVWMNGDSKPEPKTRSQNHGRLPKSQAARRWKYMAPVVLTMRASNRKTKMRHQSPSEALIAALSRIGHNHILPKRPPGKADLSYVSYKDFANPKHPNYRHPFLEFRPSLQLCVAEYINQAYAASEKELSKDSNAKSDQDANDRATEEIYRKVELADEYVEFLAHKGYTVDDVKLWTNILLHGQAESAARTLLTEHETQGSARGPVPIFVLLFLLRRPHINSQALRLLIEYTFKRLEEACSQENILEDELGLGEEACSEETLPENASGTDEATIFLLFNRLLRHARVVYPEAIAEIAGIVTRHINPSHIGTYREKAGNGTLSEKRLQKRIKRLTVLYNRVLSLLALPTSYRPFASASIQERAQFDVLRRMAEYQIPIVVTQEGYRAVTRIQLMHQKTAEERRWAELKSKSWPPWKENRTAMDMEIGPEHGVSRAGQSLRRMHEAGYSAYRWDHVMNLHAGWDEDGSPTIQSRAVFNKVQSAIVSARHEFKDSAMPAARTDPASSGSYNALQEMWAGRIRATRTLEEAWACFVSYDQLPIRQDSIVYEAMFQNIISEQKRQEDTRRHARDRANIDYFLDMKEALPGDSREVWPIPESPHERIDPRLHPPTVEELFNKMRSHGVSPSARCVALLISSAQSFKFVSRLLHQKENSEFKFLLQPHAAAKHLKSIPDPIFRAWISFCCRFWSSRDAQGRPMVYQAIDMLQRRNYNHRGSWIDVLHALSRQHARRPTDETLKPFREALVAMERANIDLLGEGFQIVCETSLQHILMRQQEAAKSESPDAWHEFLSTLPAEARFLRSHFIRLVGTDDPAWKPTRHSSTSAIALLTTPAPSVLHDFIRVLGVLRDWEGLLSMATFMAAHADRLCRHAHQAGVSGERRMRLPVIALRVFLERSWEPRDTYGSRGSTALEVDNADNEQMVPEWSETAPEEVVLLAKEKLQGIEVLGGWPTDEEVEMYLQKGRDDVTF